MSESSERKPAQLGVAGAAAAGAVEQGERRGQADDEATVPNNVKRSLRAATARSRRPSAGAGAARPRRSASTADARSKSRARSGGANSSLRGAPPLEGGQLGEPAVVARARVTGARVDANVRA